MTKIFDLTKTLPDLVADLDLLNKTLEPGFEPTPQQPSPETLFRHLYRNWAAGEDTPPYCLARCGGLIFEDSPVALYRLAGLTEPSYVHFNNMAKSDCFLTLYSICGTLGVGFKFWRHQLAAVFYCGAPLREGAFKGDPPDNPVENKGVSCLNVTANQWFHTAVKALQSPRQLSEEVTI